MGYEKYYQDGWKSGEAGGTPITPEALNHMEAGIEAAGDHADNTSNPHGVTASQIGAAAHSHTHDYLPLSGGTLTGQVRVEGNGKLTGIGTGTDDIWLYNSKSNKFLQLKDNGTLSYSDNAVYHAGNKPTAADVGALSLNGGTMTGSITLSATNGLKTSSTGGYSLDGEGNFIHQSNNTSNYFNIFSNDKSKSFRVYFETGNIGCSGSATIGGDLTVKGVALSPAMKFGTEYATHEKWNNGKTVYMKVCNVGTLPSTKVDQTYNNLISGYTQVVDYRLLAVSSTLTLNLSVYFNKNINGLVYECTTDRSAFTGYAVLKYVK